MTTLDMASHLGSLVSRIHMEILTLCSSVLGRTMQLNKKMLSLNYGQSVGSGPTLELATRLPKLKAVVLHIPILSRVRVMYPVKRTYWFDIYKVQSLSFSSVFTNLLDEKFLGYLYIYLKEGNRAEIYTYIRCGRRW